MRGTANQRGQITWISRVAHALPLLVLALSLGASFTAWRTLANAARAKGQNTFRSRVAEIVDRIADRLLDYEQFLRGGVGLLEARAEITREDWRRYVSAIPPEANGSAVLALGYAEWRMNPRVVAPIIYLESGSDTV